MKVRELAVICHNSTRPVRRVLLDPMDLKWGKCPKEYQDELIELVQANVDQVAPVFSMEHGNSRVATVVSQIIGPIVNALRDEVES